MRRDGDRLYTEIRMALDAGMASAVVLTERLPPRCSRRNPTTTNRLRARQDRPPDTRRAVGGVRLTEDEG